MKAIKETYAPVVLFVYNRPDHLRRTLQLLQENELAKESELFIYADGPISNSQEVQRVLAVRKILPTISGFKSVTIVKNEQNKGLANSVIAGVTELVNKYEKVIVLEDDLETSPDFLRFMNEALCKYEDEQKVMQISGHMFNVRLQTEKDAVFLPFISSWGWATWKRSWDMFDPSISGYGRVRKDNKMRYRFDLDGSYAYFKMLKKQIAGDIDSWAIRWYLSVFLNDGLVLYPRRSLVRHIGSDDYGTHVKQNNLTCAQTYTRLSRETIQFPHISIDRDVYDRIKKCFVSNCGVYRSPIFLNFQKIFGKLKLFVRRL